MKQITDNWIAPVSVIIVLLILGFISFYSTGCVMATAGETKIKAEPTNQKVVNAEQIDAKAMLNTILSDIETTQTELLKTKQYKEYLKAKADLEKKMLSKIPEYQRLIQQLRKRESIIEYQKSLKKLQKFK